MVICFLHQRCWLIIKLDENKRFVYKSGCQSSLQLITCAGLTRFFYNVLGLQTTDFVIPYFSGFSHLDNTELQHLNVVLRDNGYRPDKLKFLPNRNAPRPSDAPDKPIAVL